MDFEHLLHLSPIALTGVVGATIIAERAKSLFVNYKIDSAKFMGQVESMIAKSDLQGALDLCASNEKALLPNVVKAGLLKATRGEEEIKTALEVSVVDASGKIHSRIGYLAMIANVATLLGLLGTIAGLISSFKAVASADAATKQSLLANGISMSMNATALGLLVAIPVMIAYSVLNGRASRMMDDLEKGAGRTLSLLHGRVYSDEDDFSKVSFEQVEEGKVTHIKGAA